MHKTLPEFITIGVYGCDEARFFQALQEAGVDTFCDIRARRGVRGSRYAFANSKRLQARLAEMDIRYLHFPALAPSKTIRARQHAVDKTNKTAKRQRTTLSPEFVDAYRNEHLSDFDAAAFVAELGANANVVALFCVEREAAACHRSLLAERLVTELGVQVTHLAP